MKAGELGPVVVGPTGVLLGEDPALEEVVTVVPLLGELDEPVPVGRT